MTSGLIRQLCLLKLIRCSRDKRGALADCADSYSYWHHFVFCQPHSHTHTHTRPLVSKASLNIYIYKKKRDVPICPSSSGISVQYWSISESIGSHYLSSVTYLNCYGCDCCQSSSQLRVFSGSSFMEPGKRSRLASPNKDISSPCKSMLTACLPRLGDSPTLWFLIRHIMKREEIGIWVEDCVIGQADLIVFAFHLPPLMEMILIDKSPCRG